MAPPAASASSSSSQQPPTLTLSAATIATLSPHPYLLTHLQRTPSIRPNGRTPSTFRSPACTTSSLSHCFGSSVVRTGDTAVTCGIQGEILLAKDIADPPRRQSQTLQQDGQNHDRQETSQEYDESEEDDKDIRHLNLLVPNIDLATGCSPSHLPGTGPPTQEAQTLTHRLYRLLLSSRLISLSDLRIISPILNPAVELDDKNDDDDALPNHTEQTIAYWTLYISFSVLSLAGTTSLLDTLWGALLAALTDLRLPRAWWDPDREAVICSELVHDARRLTLKGRPIVVSWGVFDGKKWDGYMREVRQGVANEQHQLRDVAAAVEENNDEQSLLESGKPLAQGRRAWFLADPDMFEEALCREKVTIVLDCSADSPRLLRVEKTGGGVVGMGELRELVSAAEKRWAVWNSVLPSAAPAVV